MRIVKVPVSSWFVEIRTVRRIGRLSERVLDALLVALTWLNGPLVLNSKMDAGSGQPDKEVVELDG